MTQINSLSPALAPPADAGLAPVAAPAPGAAQPNAAYVDKVTRAAVEFESFFISNMLHQMRSGTRELASEDSVFKDPVNSDMLDMADKMLAGQLAGQRAFGIADLILRQLLPAPLNVSK